MLKKNKTSETQIPLHIVLQKLTLVNCSLCFGLFYLSDYFSRQQ